MMRSPRLLLADLLDHSARWARHRGLGQGSGSWLRRSARRLYRALLPRGPVQTRHGFRMKVHRERDAINDVIARTGTYEPATTAAILELLQPGDRVVDIGAHGGFYTLLAATRVGPTGHVYAFEPAVDNHALLEENIRLNDLTHVTIHRQAAWHEAGILRLHLQPNMTGGHSVAARRGDSVEVPAVRVDQQVSGPVRLVKIDVEGAEIEALRGMTSLLESSPGLALVVEYYPRLMERAGKRPGDLLDFLTDHGFRIRACLHGARREPPEHVDDLGDGQVNLLAERP